QFVPFDARPLDGEDAEVAVLDGRPSGTVGDHLGPQVIRVKAVIRHQDHRHVVSGLLEKRTTTSFRWLTSFTTRCLARALDDLPGDADPNVARVEVLPASRTVNSPR